MTTPAVASTPALTVTFWGAAQTVTGSMHLVEAGGRRLLLDCGLARAPRLLARPRNRDFPFAPTSIDAVILSHAHVDHCGNLPNLVRQGFAGPIYCTPATQELLRVILADSVRIQEEESLIQSVLGNGHSDRAPLYTSAHARQTIQQCVPLPLDQPHALHSALELRLVDAGHILGSAMTSLTVAAKGRDARLTFTGDLGRRGLPFLHDPSPVPAADLLLCESTYGGRQHPPLERMAEQITAVVRRTVERGGKVLVPAFSLGRTQVVVHYLQQWMRAGRMPEVPLWVDSPLAADVAEVHRRHAAHLTREAAQLFEEVDGQPSAVRYVRSPEESRQLIAQRGPGIIVAASGMCDGGRILQHLKQNVDDPRCTILLVSYQAASSLGRRLLEPRPTVRFAGRSWNLWAEVVDVHGFSGHADQDDLLAFLGPLVEDTRHVRLVHGDLAPQEALARGLRAAGFADVSAPASGDSVSVG